MYFQSLIRWIVTIDRKDEMSLLVLDTAQERDSSAWKLKGMHFGVHPWQDRGGSCDLPSA